MEAPCTRIGVKCKDRGRGDVCNDRCQCLPITGREVATINYRAQLNTDHNKLHGSDIECDGYCATDECVCD